MSELSNAMQGLRTLQQSLSELTTDYKIIKDYFVNQREETLCEVEAATSTSLTVIVGGATLTGAQGQSANDKAIQLSSSGYVTLQPKDGFSFRAGDIAVVTIWNSQASVQQTGFTFANSNGKKYARSIPAKTDFTFKYVELEEDDITDGAVKIFRNGTQGYFVNARIYRKIYATD